MTQYTHHPQHYLSTQQSHRLLAYKPPSSQSQSFIPTTLLTNINSKRSHSPSLSSHKLSRSTFVPQMYTKSPSPVSKYSSSLFQQIPHNGTSSFPASPNQSTFSTYVNYIPSPSSTAATSVLASYVSQMSHVRGPSQSLNYLNTLSYLSQSMVDPKQQVANVYSQYPMLLTLKNGSIMNGYPLQSQQ